MAGKVQFSLVALFAGICGLLAAQTARRAPEQTVTVSLPAGEKPLPPGQHRATVHLSGKTVEVQVKVGGSGPASALPAQAPGGPAPPAGAAGETESKAGPPTSASSPVPPAAPETPWMLIGLAAGVPVLLIGLGAWIYFKKIVPRRTLAPYHAALELLAAAKYREALPLLTEVEGKLTGADRRDARFFAAFAMAMTDDEAGAESAAAALYREDARDPQAAYLLAWVLLRQEKHDRAEPVLESMEKNGQLGFRDAKRLLGIVKFTRANQAFREGRIDAAAELFEKVQELGDLAPHIPADLRNRHIVLGTQALFEKDVETARKQFQQLETAASSAGGSAASLRSKARLGLASTSWVEGDCAQTETQLAEAAQLLDSKGPVSLPWPDKIPEAGVSEKLKEIEKEGATPAAAEAAVLKRCLRDIHFLRGMNVLRGWERMPGKQAHAAISDQYAHALNYFACAQARDDSFADVYLVVGLLMYYLHKPGKERDRGVDLIDRARRNRMHEPEAMEILHAREAMKKKAADAAALYVEVLDQYIGDETVSLAVRTALLKRLSAYARFTSLGKRPDLRQAHATPPTVEEMRRRSEILRTRVGDLAAGSTSDAGKLRGLSDALEKESERLLEQARTIEQKESELLAAAGDTVFRDRRN